jgi:hypothetical protein
LDEHGFIRYIHSKLPPALRKWKIHDTFAGGVPDAYYLGPSGPLWVEYKYVKTLPKRSTTLVSTCLTENQRLWLDDLHRCKQPCALVIGSGTRAVILQRGAWRSDLTVAEFNKISVDRKDIASWIVFNCL